MPNRYRLKVYTSCSQLPSSPYDLSFSTLIMAILKLTRTRVALIVVCAVLPTLFLLPLEQFKLSPHSFSLTTFDPPIKPNEAVLEAPIPPPIPPTLPITNNNATYPRSILGRNHSEYATEAQQQLARLEDIKDKLSEGRSLNAGQLDRLLAYLRKAETDSEYIPPRVCRTGAFLTDLLTK